VDGAVGSAERLLPKTFGDGRLQVNSASAREIHASRHRGPARNQVMPLIKPRIEFSAHGNRGM
jgi:hypothetical protein